MRLLFWETTIKCNLSCAHCRRLESDEAAVTDLSTAQAVDLVEQLAEVERHLLAAGVSPRAVRGSGA